MFSCNDESIFHTAKDVVIKIKKEEDEEHWYEFFKLKAMNRPKKISKPRKFFIFGLRPHESPLL